MAQNRRQAIIWTKAHPIHWHIYVALGGDELNMMNNSDKEHFKQSVECKRLFPSTDQRNTQYK